MKMTTLVGTCKDVNMQGWELARRGTLCIRVHLVQSFYGLTLKITTQMLSTVSGTEKCAL